MSISRLKILSFLLLYQQTSDSSSPALKLCVIHLLFTKVFSGMKLKDL